MVNFTQLPDPLSSNAGLEKWLEGLHEEFNPDNALINVLYARYEGNEKGPEDYPILDRPYVLDLAFKPIGDYKVSIYFSILGIKQLSEDERDYHLIEVRLDQNDFDKVQERISAELDKQGKTDFEYPSNLKIKINFDTANAIKRTEIVNETVIKSQDPKSDLYRTKITVEAEKIDPFTSNRAKLSYKHRDVAYAKSKHSSFNCLKKDAGWVIETTRIPVYFEKRNEIIKFDFDFSYENLTKCSTDELNTFVSLVKKRTEQQIASLKSLSEEKKTQNKDKRERIEREFMSDIGRLENEVKVMEQGVLLLSKDKEMLEAFRLLNRIFLSRHKLKDTAAHGRINDSWRSFQLAFIISQLPELANERRTVTLLNFPTGTGKTEAFFGFAILKILYERLKKTNHGTSVIIKYPRKLLSRQQVKRALELVSFSNAVLFRSKKDLLLHPISLGTLFNSEDTPNRYVDSQSNYRKVSGNFREWETDPYNRAVRVTTCPYCGSKIKISATEPDLRIRFMCAEESCIFNEIVLNEFFERVTGELPLYIGDDEVFRYLPSILITTIDKFSSFAAYNSNFKTLLLDDQIKCDSKYGFYFGEKEFEHFGTGKSGKEIAKERFSKYFKCPSLFIFDEIHLVNGSYASKLSIMENAFLDLFVKKSDSKPHIICSSATINQTFNGGEFVYESDFGKIFHVAPEEVTLYPVLWSTFTEESNETIRVIKSIMPSNFSNYLAVEHTSEYYLKVFQRMSETDKTFYSTLLYYFKAKARLERVRGSIAERVIDKEKRRGRLRYSPDYEMEFSTDIEQNIMAKEQQYLDDKPTTNPTKCDLVWATNTIANGLDNEGFNLMFIFGFPNKISEYVQARSRIARRQQTGLCISILNQKDVRETSMFLDFHDLHENVSLAIEANPVNLETRGIVESMLKKLFHLALQTMYDSKERPFYLKRTLTEVLNDPTKLNSIKEQVYKWFSFEETPEDESRKFFGEVWQKYIDDYGRALRELIKYTIYEDKKNAYVPQPTLIDISPPIKIKLSQPSAILASSLSTEATVYGDQPNEAGDDQSDDLSESNDE